MRKLINRHERSQKRKLIEQGAKKAQPIKKRNWFFIVLYVFSFSSATRLNVPLLQANTSPPSTQIKVSLKYGCINLQEKMSMHESANPAFDFRKKLTNQFSRQDDKQLLFSGITGTKS